MALEVAKRMLDYKKLTLSRLSTFLLDADREVENMQELANLIKSGKNSIDMSNSLMNRYMTKADFAYYEVSKSPFAKNNNVDSVRKYLRLKKRRK